MPLGEREGDTSISQIFGVETHFNKSMAFVLDKYIHIEGGFDFVAVPLMSPVYHPRMHFGSLSLESLEASMMYAESDLNHLPSSLWNSRVMGKISEWIDLDSPDQNLRKDSENTFKQEMAWASYLHLQACLLPTPKGTTWANYARCINQILQNNISGMKFLLRIPLGKPGDDSKICKTPGVDYWKTWNSFRLLCDHNHNLLVALDNLSTMPSDNSLNSWYGEPVSAFIIHTDSFITRDGDDMKHLSEGLQKLITYFWNHSGQIILSEKQVNSKVNQEYHHFDTSSAEGSGTHSLQPYLDYLRSLYQQMDPLSEQERAQIAFRDVLQPTLHPFKDDLKSVVYLNSEKDKKKHIVYKRAIRKALLDRVPKKKASVITTVLVVVGGRGTLVRASLEAAEETGRKIKVYAVEKNLNALAYLHKLCNLKGWNDIVTVIQTDVRNWNAPEKADILVSELLGTFGDDELAPESLDRVKRFMKIKGISIPSLYTSFLQPVKASKLYNEVKAENNILRFEAAFIAKMHIVARLAPCQPLFTFTHPKPSDKESNQQYSSLRFVIPGDLKSTIVHGFAGYFDATLYKDVHLRTEPSKATPDVSSWNEIYFPLRAPICVHGGSVIEVHFWRCCDSTKVWYEWCVTSPTSSPIYNCNARADCVWL